MIDRATAQKIKDTADIVEVVSDYVHLTRRGANYMGLCPFHNERTPSFSVNRRKNFCYCFSCKKGGSPVNFIMEKEGLTYNEALMHLAKKYGIEVQERELTDEERRQQSEHEAMLIANEWAMRQMETDMRDTDEGRDVGMSYLTQRGVTDEAMRAFHLGYAIDNGQHLTNAAAKAGYDIEVLKKLGLLGTSREGRVYDRFRGRVIFPILNTAGKTIAFGGRDLKGGLAKYINSPESELYKKSNELYGIFQARSAIVREDKCYLVEGYMDVIGMWQSGMKNVVASSGTALTDGQIAMIHRFTQNITLIYDGDAAGIKASLRGIDMLLRHKMNVKLLLLPDNDDPDSFARKHTPEEFKEYVAAHETDIIRYKAKVLLSNISDDPHRRIEAVNSVVESIAHIPDPVSRDVYVQECSSILGMPASTIATSVARKHAELLEKWRKEREWKRNGFSGTPDSRNQQASPDSMSSQNDRNNQGVPDTQTPAPSARPQDPRTMPFYPLERQVIKYCVRYGFVKCLLQIDEEGNETDNFIDVAAYVQEELRADDMRFSVGVFNRILEIIESLRPAFREQMARREHAIEEECRAKREEGRTAIASRDLSMYEIEKAEAKLEEEIALYREEELAAEARNFAARQLASHEEEEVRSATLELIKEKHHLSNIYLKDGTAESEEDRLHLLVPRAIVEWKSELLNQQLRKLLARFKQISGKGDAEEEHRLQSELDSLMKLRSEVARNIGERVLHPRRL